MNYRKMMLVAFLLLAVLTLGAVSASEDADALAADSVDEVSVDASLDDEIISEGGGNSLASSDDASALEVTSENFEFDYQTHEAVSKQEDEVLHVWWHDSEWGNLNLQVYDSSNNIIYDGNAGVFDANGEHSWTVPDLFSGNDYALGYYTFDLVFTDMDDNEVNIIDDLQFQLTYCNIEEYRDESVYIDYPFDVIRIYERTEVLDVYVNNVKIDNERNYDDGPTAWNLTELGITQPGMYNIIINATNPNLGHVETFVMTLNVTGYDPNEWRVFTNYEGIHDFDENDPVIYLYCANEDTQNIVAIAPNEVQSYRDSVTGAMLSWTLSDLGIEENGDYKIYIGNGFDTVVPPVWINVWHMDDNGEEDEEDEDWILDYNSDLITFRHLVMLSDRYDSGRLEITDSQGNVLFNRSVYEMEPNYDMMGYKYDQYDGYVVFKEDLNTNDTGVYDLTITYYDDENEIVESVNTTVCLDYDSYVTDEEIDINDNDSTLFSIHVFEDVMNDGQFEIELIAGEDDDEYPYISQNIDVEEVAGDTLDITMQNYALPEGVYNVRVRYISNDDDPDDHYVQYWKYSYFHDRVTIVDNTKFRVRMESDSIIDENSQFLVYCPQDYVGQTITIEVASDDGSYSIDYAIPTSGYNCFTLDDLSITDPGMYQFNIYGEDDESLIETYEYEFGNPLSIPEICVLGTEGLERSPVVVLYTDKIDNGRLVLTYGDGNVLFNESLTDQYYNTLGYDKGYYILYSDIANLSADTYDLTASYYCDGILRLTKSAEIRVVERKIEYNDGISIEIFNYYDHNLGDEEDLIAIVAIPGHDGGHVEVEIMNEDNETLDPSFYYDIGDDDGIPVFYISLYDHDIEDGNYLVNVTYFDEHDDQVLSLSDWLFLYYGGGYDDDIIDEIEFNVLEDEDGQSVFEIGDDVHVASLFIPDYDEHVDSGVTITITKNGEQFYEVSTSDIGPDYHENMMAYEYPIFLDLTGLEDRDLLEFNVDCFDENGRVWAYAIEINGNDAIFHWYEEMIEYYVFYGNTTTGDLNDPELMGPHPDENFIRFSVPEAYGVTEGGVVITDGSGATILEKSLDDFENVGYSYDVLGNVYTITLEDFNPYERLTENETITVTLTAGNVTVTQKRIRNDDYVYKILTPDDFTFHPWSEYSFEVADEANKKDNDAVVIFANSNMQSIYIDFGGGYFSVYVDGEKVEGLGWVLYEAWKNSDEYVEFDDEGTWGSELDLMYLRGGSVALSEFHLSLADLNITEEGTHNITITHTPDDPETAEEPYIYPVETEIINEDITYNPDVYGVEISPESKYKNDMPFLFTFDLGDNLLSESSNILIYINGTLAFNRTTLYWEENEEGENELVELCHVPASWLDESILNEYGTLDAGEYEAVVCFEDEDGDQTEIARDNFAILKQRGDMNFTMDYCMDDDGKHTVIYANIPDGDWQDYSLIINVGDSQEIYPDDNEEWDGWNTWFDEYCIFKDDDIFDKDSLDLIIGQGTFAIDLGVLDDGTHVRVSFDYGYDPVDPNLNFYHNEFTVIGNDKVDTVMSASDITTVYGSYDYFIATLTDVYGNAIDCADVVIEIDGVSYALVSDFNGEAWLYVSTLTPGVYYANVYFEGDGNYNPSAIENVKVYIKKIGSTLTASDVVALYGRDGNLVATLEDKNGNALSNVRVYITVDGTKSSLKTDDNGQVALSTADLSIGSHAVEFQFKGTTYYYSSTATAEVMVVDKINTTLDASSLTTSYGSGTEFVATLNDAYGNAISGADVVITLDGVNTTVVTDDNGEARLDVTTLTPNVYYATVSYAGSSSYAPSVKENVKVYIKKITTTLTASNVHTPFNTGEYLVAVLKDANGNGVNKVKVYVTIDGVKSTLTTDSNGEVRLSTAGLDIGSHTAEIQFKGTTYYYSSSTTTMVVIDKAASTLSAPSLTTTYGSGEFVVNMNDAYGNPISDASLIVTIDGENVTLDTDDNGEARLDVSAFEPNVYYADVFFGGNYFYYPAFKENVKIYIKKITTDLTAPDIVTAYNSGDYLVATLKDGSGNAISGVRVFITIDGVTSSSVSDLNGQVKRSTSGLDVGEYVATIQFKGTTHYYSSTTTANVIVADRLNTTLDASSLTTYYDSGAEFVATLNDAKGNAISGASLIVSIDGVNMTVVTGDNGEARLDVTGLTPAVYYATVYFEGNDNYNPSVKENVKVYIKKISSTLTAPDVVTAYNSGDYLVATLKDGSGNAISGVRVFITIDGVTSSSVSDINGQVKRSTSGLSIGEHTAEIQFKGSTYYYSSTTTANVMIVDKLDTTLSAPSLTTAYGSGEFVATLKDANGNAISGASLIVSIDGVNMTIVTDANGEARLDVSALEPNVYYATVYFEGNDNYNPSVKENVKVYIKKITTVLTAPDVATTYNSGDYLVATLKDVNGNAVNKVKVYITINGVKSTLTTDSNGQVRLSTGGLSAGSYVAEIQFKGTTHYYSSTTTANVVISE